MAKRPRGSHLPPKNIVRFATFAPAVRACCFASSMRGLMRLPCLVCVYEYSTPTCACAPAALFFVGFIIAGAMFTLNLVVSAIVNHYLAFKEECEGRGLTLSEDQYRWVQSTRLMLRFKVSDLINAKS